MPTHNATPIPPSALAVPAPNSGFPRPTPTLTHSRSVCSCAHAPIPAAAAAAAATAALQVGRDDCFLILASDGVWEFIDMDEAVALVDHFYTEGKRAMDACRLLIAKAALAWRINEGHYRDDITAIVAYLPPLVEGLSTQAKQQRRQEAAPAGAGAAATTAS
jgi:hypothetical protein